MVVKIRFGRGVVVSHRSRKNRRIARLAASLLTLVSISCASLGIWRIGTDLEWAGDFAFADGLLSHWQVWIAAAIAVQYVSWQLARYAGHAIAPGAEDELTADSTEAVHPADRATTNA